MVAPAWLKFGTQKCTARSSGTWVWGSSGSTDQSLVLDDTSGQLIYRALLDGIRNRAFPSAETKANAMELECAGCVAICQLADIHG